MEHSEAEPRPHGGRWASRRLSLNAAILVNVTRLSQVYPRACTQRLKSQAKVRLRNTQKLKFKTSEEDPREGAC
jgi:hypothetical protein